MKKIYLLLVVLASTIALVSCSRKPVLKLYIPNDYIDKDLLKEFGKEHGAKVKMITFDSNEVALGQIQANSYDVVVPSEYAIEELVNKDLLEKIDYREYVDDSFELTDNLDRFISYLSDDGFEFLDYAVPYFFGTLGILYNHNKIELKEVETKGFKIIGDSDKTTILYDSSRDAFMLSLLNEGIEIHSKTLTEKNLDDAAEWLKEIVKKGKNTSILSDEILTDMLTGTKYDAVVSYSGDAVYIMDENDNYSFYNPNNTNLWVDGFVIPKNSKQKELAKEFIKFMTTYESSLANTLEVGYTSVRKDVYLEVTKSGGDFSDEILKYAYDANLEDFQVFRYNKDLKKYIDESWAKVLASQGK